MRTNASAADAAALAADVTDPGEAVAEEEDPDEIDNEEQNVSLAAMEITLLPQVLATFEQVAATYKRLHSAGAWLEAIAVTRKQNRRWTFRQASSRTGFLAAGRALAQPAHRGTRRPAL